MSFSLQPVWPPMFVSRLCTRGDPLCMLRVGLEANRAHVPSVKALEGFSGKASKPAPQLGVRMVIGATAWRVWSLLKSGPHTTTEVCNALDLVPTSVGGAARRLVQAGVLNASYGPQPGRQITYSMGTAAVVEVEA